MDVNLTVVSHRHKHVLLFESIWHPIHSCRTNPYASQQEHLAGIAAVSAFAPTTDKQQVRLALDQSNTGLMLVCSFVDTLVY